MICWLKGQVIQKWSLSNKAGVVINCSGVGYEVQLLNWQLEIFDQTSIHEIWSHQINREDSSNLYGFKDIIQRDLFRKLISVSGIGAQIGMALLEDLEAMEIVNAIQENNIKLLTKSQGVGKRIAERLVVDLKNKLNEIKSNKIEKHNENKHSQPNNFNKYLKEIKSILNSLGYLDEEINHSLELLETKEKISISKIDPDKPEERNQLMEKHIKEILIRFAETGLDRR